MAAAELTRFRCGEDLSRRARSGPMAAALARRIFPDEVETVDRRRVQLLIRGQVQGVFYRGSARAEATRLGLAGWVRNLPSGEVEAVAEGPDDAVRAFIEWCQHGPEQAEVDSVTVSPAPASDARDFSSFVVLR